MRHKKKYQAAAKRVFECVPESNEANIATLEFDNALGEMTKELCPAVHGDDTTVEDFNTVTSAIIEMVKGNKGDFTSASSKLQE